MCAFCARFCSFFFYNIYDSLYDLNVYYYLLSGSQSNSRINYKRTYMYEATTDAKVTLYELLIRVHVYASAFRYIITNSARCRVLYI